MSDILEVEFQFGNAMSIPPFFDNVEYYDLIWKFERMASQREKENEEAKKQQGYLSLGDMHGG